MKKATKKPIHPADEQAFLSAYDASRYPHPSLAVDVALFTVDQAGLRVALIRRKKHPDLGRWSLPGGFVGIDESLDDTAARVLKTKLGLSGIFLEQLYTFGAPDRDPRTRVIAVAYYALVNAERFSQMQQEDACVATIAVPWEGERGGKVKAKDDKNKTLPIAFDHADILGLAVQRLRGKLDYAPIGFELLPRKFTLRRLQSIHESILGKKLNKDSFRRRMISAGLVAPTGELEKDVGHRPAELYRFRRKGLRS